MTPRTGMEKAGPIQGPPLTILIVDDDPVFRGALFRLLTLEGHLVRAVATGRQALDALELTTCELVCIDARLPDIHGARLARCVRARLPECFIALISGDAIAVDDAELRTFCVDMVLPKPWRPGELETVLARARAPTGSQVVI